MTAPAGSCYNSVGHSTSEMWTQSMKKIKNVVRFNELETSWMETRNNQSCNLAVIVGKHDSTSIQYRCIIHAFLIFSI